MVILKIRAEYFNVVLVLLVYVLGNTGSLPASFPQQIVFVLYCIGVFRCRSIPAVIHLANLKLSFTLQWFSIGGQL